MREQRQIVLALSDAQVSQVVLQASGDTTLAGPLSEIQDVDELRRIMVPLIDDLTYSRSTFRAVFVLAAFPPDGSERELTAVARALGLSPSTTHRYVRTWTALGLLEQNPDSRRYRRPRPEDANPPSRQLDAS